MKKLVDEDEFQPEKPKKPPLVIDLKYATSLEVIGNTPPQSNQRQRNPVEVVGKRPTTAVMMSTTQQPQTARQNTNNKSNSRHYTRKSMSVGGHRAEYGSNEYNNNTNNNETDDYYDDDDDVIGEYGENIRVDKPRLVKQRKPKAGVIGLGTRLGEALNTGANYHRIIDTLTDRLANVGGDNKPSLEKRNQTIRFGEVRLQRAATFFRSDLPKQQQQQQQQQRAAPVGFFPRRDDPGDSSATVTNGSSPSTTFINRNR